MKQPNLRLFADVEPKRSVLPVPLPLHRVCRTGTLPRSAEQAPARATPGSSTLVRLVKAEVAKPAAAAVNGVALEAAIIAALDAPPAPDERPSETFRRKEVAVGELFAALSVMDAHHLYKRLSVRHADDPIAQRFGRLVTDRQDRLMNFLGDARRRAAIARSC